MPAVTALATLGELRATGSCTGADLDGVAELARPQQLCADTLGQPRCAAMLSTGMFSCATDFCSRCSMTSQCDTTCGFCGGGTAAPSAGSGHRRALQGDGSDGGATTCDPASFAARATVVTADCCDDAAGSCGGGVATSCDAKCGTTYVPFFRSCR